MAGPFGRSRACFEAIVERLSTADDGGRTHALLEEQLVGEGRELVRTLLRDHLDLRAVREQRQERVVDADGVAHTRV